MVKTAVLKWFRFAADGFREKFNAGTPVDGEIVAQFAARLTQHFDRWIELSETATEFHSLRELLMREKFLHGCHLILSLYLKEGKAKSLEAMLDLAEQIIEAHRGTNLTKSKRDSRDDPERRGYIRAPSVVLLYASYKIDEREHDRSCVHRSRQIWDEHVQRSRAIALFIAMLKAVQGEDWWHKLRRPTEIEDLNPSYPTRAASRHRDYHSQVPECNDSRAISATDAFPLIRLSAPRRVTPTDSAVISLPKLHGLARSAGGARHREGRPPFETADSCRSAASAGMTHAGIHDGATVLLAPRPILACASTGRTCTTSATDPRSSCATESCRAPFIVAPPIRPSGAGSDHYQPAELHRYKSRRLPSSLSDGARGARDNAGASSRPATSEQRIRRIRGLIRTATAERAARGPDHAATAARCQINDRSAQCRPNPSKKPPRGLLGRLWRAKGRRCSQLGL
ncbi:hypothetical protein HPB49_022381 [Dermacentor silvarum]|uniref:Uncharacterized protein n=1 Tax=Dermacentor silvarum TaxID=543639 RepID=A0ACB8E2T7_DERSI|nr:hypothetical protein HPB49_022381 [Dermacentor silvarum]